VARLPRILALGFCVLFVALPLAAILWDTVAGPDGLDFSGYRTILANAVDRQQLAYSVELGLVATAIALVLGGGHAWLTHRTDLPGGKVLGPLGVLPLAMPPILVAMGFADLADVAGFWTCAALLGVSFAPFPAVLAARGLRAVDGRSYEAALLARGRGAAERLTLRAIAPEVAAGCLLAFVFTISEHGVPEFLTVKGKTWHTYAEGVFARWTRRATGVEHADLVSPIVAALPLVLIVLIALAAALRLRAHTSIAGDFRPLPQRRLGAWRWPALAVPLTYLGAGVALPLVVMGRWAAGSTQALVPPSLATARRSFQLAVGQAGGDLGYTIGIGIATTAVLLCVSLPLAWRAARGRRGIELACAVPLAVPAVVLAIGFVHVYNSRTAGAVYETAGFDFYDSPAVVVAAYAARFLPFGVLTLAHALRRIPAELEDAARLTGRSPAACARRVGLPLALPAAWSAACLAFILALRELDVAVVLPAGNGTVVRRLSNVVHFGGEDMGGALAILLLGAALAIPTLTVIVTGRKLTSLS
jgi:iron(III) transport system permease protein